MRERIDVAMTSLNADQAPLCAGFNFEWQPPGG